MKRGMNFWDILAWVVLFLILLWLVLKVLGVINTSDLVEYSPYFGAVYLAGWAVHKLKIVADDTKELKNFEKATIKEISNIKIRCARNHHEF